MKSWFYLKNGKVTGPVHEEDIRKLISLKKIGGFDLVYRNDEKKWKPVMEYSEYEGEFQGASQKDPVDEVTGSYDLSELRVSLKEKEKQWVILRILDRMSKPVKTEQVGPFSSSAIQKMIRSGDLGFQDYVWTDGMRQWGLLVQEEELVPKVELPKLVKELTVEDTVEEPQESGEELFKAVEVTQIGKVEKEIIPKGVRPIDLVQSHLEGEFDEETDLSVEMGSDNTDDYGPISLDDDLSDKVSEDQATDWDQATVVDQATQKNHQHEVGDSRKINKFQVEEVIEDTSSSSKKQQSKAIDNKQKGKASGTKKDSQSNKKNKKKNRSDTLADSPYQKSAKGEWSYRLLQGLLGAFIIGGIVGIAVYISHSSRTKDEFEFHPKVETVAPKVEKVTATATPPVKEVKIDSKKVAEKPDKPTPPPQKAPSFVKLQLKNITGNRPKVLVDTDASHHYSADLLITAAAGQTLSHPSYHREWTVKEFHQRYRTLDFRSLGLKEGWYTVLVNIENKRALKTFFVGSKVKYNSRIRDFRKKLGYQHQEEKEQMYYFSKELLESLQKIKKQGRGRKGSPEAFKKIVYYAQKDLARAQRTIGQRIKNKNNHLWSVYWIQFEDLTERLDSFFKDLVKSNDPPSYRKMQVLSRDTEKLHEKIQDLKVVN